MVRHQLIVGAQAPISKGVEAAGAKLFATLIDEVADRLAGVATEESADPAIRKLRSFQ